MSNEVKPIEFRDLRAEEIECRVQSVISKNTTNGCILLIYKDARCDMNILDESVGCEYWKREHKIIDGNLFCTVSIYSTMMGQWISKEDVGTESMSDKEKGQASDSFKRACFNWGIGRELYTSPFIWVNLDKSEIILNTKGKPALSNKVKFSISKIKVENKKIIDLAVIDQNGKQRFSMSRVNKDNNKPKVNKFTEPYAREEITQYLKNLGLNDNVIRKCISSLKISTYVKKDSIDSNLYKEHINNYIDKCNINLAKMLLEAGITPKEEGFKNDVEALKWQMSEYNKYLRSQKDG